MLASLTTAIVLILTPFTGFTGTDKPSGLSSTPLEIGEITATRIQQYAASVAFQEGVEYIATLQAEEEATRLRTAQEVAQARPVTAPRPSSGGGHSDAWWMGVATCEQGGRNDPYFGYFSFMDGSQGGRSWSDQVAAGNALLSTVSSESPAWAPACVAAGYAASPGG